MATIDIGSPAIQRPIALTDNYTWINKGNPADGTGTITSFEVWANSNVSGCEIATFYEVSPNFWSTRDTVTIGNITAGSKQTLTEDSENNPISLEVQIGDYIGIYFTAGLIGKDYTGFSGIWWLSGKQIPCTNVEEDDFLGGDAFSLYGIGAEEPTHNFFGYNSS